MIINSLKKVKHARHAIALDEIRYLFNVEMMETDGETDLKQVWFPGDHGCIGGGCNNQIFSKTTLAWMVEEIEKIPKFDLEVDKQILFVGPKNCESAKNPPEYRLDIMWFLSYLGGIFWNKQRSLENLDPNITASQNFKKERSEFQKAFDCPLPDVIKLSMNSLIAWLMSSKRWLCSRSALFFSPLPPKASSSKKLLTHEFLHTGEDIQSTSNQGQDDRDSSSPPPANSIVPLSQAPTESQAASSERNCHCCGAPLQ